MPIPTSNILQPGSIGAQANLALVSGLQLLTPQYKKEYVLKYGNEDFTGWLSTYAGMEQVKNREYFWFENRGKLMQGTYNLNAVVAPAAGATVTLTLPAEFHFNNGTQTPIRPLETVRISSSQIEGQVLAIVDTTPFAFQYTVRPKQSTQAFVSANSANLLANEGLEFGGYMDAGEASNSIIASQDLDVKYTNTWTEMRESYSTTDLGEMTDVFYSGGVGGAGMPGAQLAGTSYYTYKNLLRSEQRYANYCDRKLMFGDIVNNTGLSSTNSVGSQGILPKVLQDGETVTYNPGTLDIAKMHEITRIADVNGCAKECLWLQDIYQHQDFSDGIFAAYPAGAYVWGKNETSEEAMVTYGTKTMNIDGYMLSAKKYVSFNPEVTYGISPANPAYENFGMLCPLGTSPKYQAKGEDKVTNIKNITIMYQDANKGGTYGNGIRVWTHGGGSINPTNGQMVDNVEFITYKGTRISAANQFILVQKP